MAAIVLAAVAAAPAAGELPEYAVKAELIHRFTTFIRWPQTSFSAPRSPFVVCLVGEDSLEQFLDDMVDKERRIQGRPLEVRTLEPGDSTRGCHALWVAASEAERMPAIMRSVRGKPILTLGDSPEFVQACGILNFVADEKRIRYELNLAQAEKAGLRVPTEILRHAEKVECDEDEILAGGTP